MGAHQGTAYEPAPVTPACSSVPCLAVLSLVTFLGVAAIAGALHVIATITSALGIAVRKDADPWHGAVGDAHPLDYIEVPR